MLQVCDIKEIKTERDSADGKAARNAALLELAELKAARVSGTRGGGKDR